MIMIISYQPLSVFNKFIMDQYAASIKSDIELFLLKYVPTKSLIRANNTEVLGSLKIETDELSEEETDKLIYYLVGTFPQLRDLGCHDISELVHDTVKFVIQKSKERGKMSIDEKSSLDDVYHWLIQSGVSIETSSIFKGSF